MVVTLEGGCRVSQMHDGEPLVAGTVRVWKQTGRATGAQAISLSVIEYAPGISPAIQNDECDQILYVVNDREAIEETHDSASIRIAIDGNVFPISLDTGIYIRANQKFSIDNSSGRSITIVGSQCPDPNRETQIINAPPTEPAAVPLDPLPIVRLADQRAQPTADRWYRVLI